jgi:magnesium transporter
MAEQPKIDLDDTIEQHMRRSVIRLPEPLTVGEALEKLRGEQLPEQIVYLYVIDADERLVGVVPTRRLLMSPLSARISDLCVRSVIAIPAHATVLDACEFFLTHKFLAFPVVDARRKLLGIVDVGLFTNELQALSERAAADEIFQLIGVHVSQGRRPSPWRGFLTRFPWLISNIIGGILCAFMSGFFDELLQAVIVLALFLPVVLALSESVSIQAMTITLQELHGGRVGWKRLWIAMRRELAVAALLGLACGAVVAAVAWAWKGDLRVAAVLQVSLLLGMITACLLGVLLPTAVRALGRDPRIASGPVVLACGDVAALLFYFNVGAWLLQRTP